MNTEKHQRARVSANVALINALSEESQYVVNETLKKIFWYNKGNLVTAQQFDTWEGMADWLYKEYRFHEGLDNG